MPYILTPLAEQDYSDIILKLAERTGTWRWSLELEEKLLDTFDALAANPGLGHLREDLVPRRVYFYNVPPYQILYLQDPARLIIVAIIHGSRDIHAIMQDR
jgi:plasmid stabilization system protein ParE